MGPDVHGRHLLRIPSPWLGQMKGLRFCGGDEGRDGDHRLRREDRGGEGSTLILQSDRSAWKAFLASVQCKAAGSLPGVAVGGTRMVPINGPFLPSGTSEKN